MYAFDRPDADLGSSQHPLTAAIIGAGFAGIGMAVALLRAGVHDFVVLEKSADVGGCWRDNTYPGAACDVPSHLYSFSFEPKWDWSRRYAPQQEILAYLRHCARKYGVMARTRFHAEVHAARWDEAAALWRVRLTDGVQVCARLLITATGQLSQPAYPCLKGMDSFAGRAFHSAHWDHNWPLLGKTVAVVGTGASSIQFVPEVVREASAVKVFQRTPNFVIPRADRPYRAWEQALLRSLPGAMKLVRAKIYIQHEARALGFIRLPRLLDLLGRRQFEALLTRQVTDPQLRRKLTPDYAIGCKRILISNDYYPALTQPHVELVTDAIAEVVPEGLRTVDGWLHRADTLIYGTGFAATAFLSPMRIAGVDGQDLNQVWKDGAQAYLGLTVPGFPNFFMLYGPNTNLGHSSIIYMLESQIRHVMRCHQRMRQAQALGLEISTEAYARYNQRVQKGLGRTAWGTGCTSWYLDAQGRNTVNWPGFTFTYRWLTGRGDLDGYRLIR